MLALLATVGIGLTLRTILHEIQALRLVDPVTEPIQLENRVMNPTCVQRTKTVEGVTHTLTWYQQEGESWEDFIRRVNEEWDAYCEGL